ncbi:MAG: hypothetical protein V1871_02720 [Planctomycetota bacterium]
MSLKPLEVKTGNIASYAVTESKLAPNSVGVEKIKDGSVKTDKIGDKQVTVDKIADRSISTTKIIDSAITGIKIADGTITKDKISDGVLGRPLTPPVASVEIADNAVSETKIQNNAVTADKIKASAVTADKLATNSVTKVKLASNSVGYLEIINGSIEPRHIRAIDTPANGEVPSYNQLQERFEWIAPGGGGAVRPLVPPVATDEIGELQVTGSKLQGGAVTKTKLSYKVVSITIPALQVGGLYPPLGDPDLNGGVILGYSIPVNQDQLIRQLFLLPGLPQGTGVSILMNQPAIADNTFDVVVLRG